MIIALTGIMGSGKTTAASFFREMGFGIIDVDSIGHEILKRQEVKKKLAAVLGDGILDGDGQIDRTALGDTVFSDRKRLDKLNKIVHPLMMTEIKSRLSGDVVIDAALWEELDLKEMADVVILVKSDPENSYARYKNRYSKEKMDNIVSNQSTVKAPDYLLENNGTVEDLKQKVRELCEGL
jgi:dephospho-CoA kinase